MAWGVRNLERTVLDILLIQFLGSMKPKHRQITEIQFLSIYPHDYVSGAWLVGPATFGELKAPIIVNYQQKIKKQQKNKSQPTNPNAVTSNTSVKQVI